MHHANLAEIFRIQGDYVASQWHAREALAIAAGNGNPQTAAVAKLEAGMTHLAMGELATAEELLSEGRTAAELVGSPNNLYDALSALALLCVRAGRVAEALNWIAETAIVETYLAANRIHHAIEFGATGLARRVAAGHGLTVTRLRVVLGRAHAAAGDFVAARSL